MRERQQQFGLDTTTNDAPSKAIERSRKTSQGTKGLLQMPPGVPNQVTRQPRFAVQPAPLQGRER